MNVLIGCEESGVIRRAFREQGHNAWSCDLLPARDNSPFHIQMDIFYAIKHPEHYLSSEMVAGQVFTPSKWDLIILHPPCTALAVSGNSTYGEGMPKHEERLKAIKWTMELWNFARSHCRRVVMENPVSVIWKYIRQTGVKVQYIHPWEFGHPEQKKTGLALSGVDPLEETNNVYQEMMKLPKKDREKKHYMSPGPNRSRDRSETYQGWADAMAKQWGDL